MSKTVETYVPVLAASAKIPAEIPTGNRWNWTCARMKDRSGFVLRVLENGSGWLVRIPSGAVAAHWSNVGPLEFWRRADAVCADVPAAEAAKLAKR